jgi:uncharacterized protein
LAQISTYAPYVSFIAGLTGSLHCLGMCGGLVTASCGQGQGVFRYQLGRLLGYLSLGIVASFAGQAMTFTWGPLISALLMGLTFIYWGAQNFRRKHASVPAPKIFGRWYKKLWGFSKARPFFLGLISILLPCGLLYGIVVSTLALSGLAQVSLSIFTFWLGTLPALVAAPTLLHKFIGPLRQQLPRAYGVGLILIGLLTISQRIDFTKNTHATVPEKHSCH